MTKDEALKMALDFIEKSEGGTADLEAHIKEALAQPSVSVEQEPVGWAEHGVINWLADKQFNHTSFLYDTPQRTWVGLTKEERHEISMANRPYCANVMAAHEEELKRRNT